MCRLSAAISMFTEHCFLGSKSNRTASQPASEPLKPGHVVYHLCSIRGGTLMQYGVSPPRMKSFLPLLRIGHDCTILLYVVFEMGQKPKYYS